ncbi:hypothetical protein C5S31_07685, partial [ANME-1 cluster archaeon GoMg2]|nr:hypothetical protein [ANME-1 cluster archaeon GoMg2]
MNEKKVCVVGMGVMGTGIVQVCVQAGYDTSVVTKDDGSLERGVTIIKKDISRLAKKGRITQ